MSGPGGGIGRDPRQAGRSPRGGQGRFKQFICFNFDSQGLFEADKMLESHDLMCKILESEESRMCASDKLELEESQISIDEPTFVCNCLCCSGTDGDVKDVH